MMDRPCEDMQERIADYVLGALDEREAEVVRDHLGECEACRAYMRDLTEQGEALTALGQQVQDDMHAREDTVIEALEAISAPAGEPGWVLPWTGRLLRTAVAAVLVLGVGITIGRLTAAEPIDVGQLRLDLEQSVAASLRPSV
ncbi:MAG: zf-HC2 domain-containing protein, partial [Planctomycetota bacterium]